MTTNSKSHSATDLLDLMKTGKLSAKEYAVDLSEKVKQLEYLNSKLKIALLIILIKKLRFIKE